MNEAQTSVARPPIALVIDRWVSTLTDSTQQSMSTHDKRALLDMLVAAIVRGAEDGKS